MLSVIITLTIFAFFALVGYAAVLLAVRQPEGSHILLAPTVGAAVVVLPTMLANYLGMPVQFVGPPLALVLLVASAIVIARSPRPALPRWFLLIAGALLVGLCLNAWPMFIFGRNWMAFVNGDMETYVNTATNIFARGFLAPINAHAYVQQRAMSLGFEWRYVLMNRRSGSENLIAFWMSVFGRSAYSLYMPLIVAAQLALISAASALVYNVRQSGRVAVATAFVLACSPLLTLGLDHQLLPQVIGIALLIAALVFLCRPIAIRPVRPFLAAVCLSGLVLAAYASVYPETTPIFAVAVFFYYVFAIIRRTTTVSSALVWIGANAAVAAVFLNVHLTTLIEMLALTLQFGAGSAAGATVFTAYLIPSGLADLLGLSAVTWTYGHGLTWAIISSTTLLVLTLVAMVVMVVRGRFVAFGLLAMLLGVPVLFVHQNGFALYKLAMYVQPFLAPTLLLWWDDRVRDSSPVAAVTK